MEERRLNLNAPLLSVRRNLSSPSLNLMNSLKGRTTETPRPKFQRTILASENVDLSMDQVTGPVAVPFTWEQVPGKTKDDGEPELLPSEETLPVTPRIPPRNSSGIRDNCSQKEFREMARMDKTPVTDDDDSYSDAVDTLSQTDSFLSSISCSVSGLSGSDGPVMKPSGTFSLDTQTRDFMMDRFLPAARALATASESSFHHTSRKQHLLLAEQPEDVKKPQVLASESRALLKQHTMEIVQHYTQDICQTESSEEEGQDDNDKYSDYSSVPGKGCGMLPQLCLRSSWRLFNPVPGIKSKMQNSMPFVPPIRKDLKDEYSLSNSQPVSKSAGPQWKPDYQVKNPKLDRGQINPHGGTNQLNFLGEQQRTGRLSPFRRTRTDVTVLEKRELSQPSYVSPLRGGLGRRNFSGELRPAGRLSPFRPSRNDVAILDKNESTQPSYVVPPLGGSSRLNFSCELQTTSRLSPFRPSRNDVPILEKKQSSQPSYVPPPLGGSNRLNYSGELRTTSRLSPFRPSRSNLVSEKKESSELSYVPPPPLGWSSGLNFSGELQTWGRLSPLRPQRNHSVISEKIEPNMLAIRKDGNKDVSLNKATGCMSPVSPAFERTLYVDTVNAACKSCSDSNSPDCEVWMDPVVEELLPVSATREVQETSTAESSLQDIECLDVITRDETVKDVNKGFLDSPSLPLPSLRSPSESWLWRTLPSISAKSPFSPLQKTDSFSSKKHDSDTCMPETKWETIVKTSKAHHDHTRYSEELIDHISRQYKS